GAVLQHLTLGVHHAHGVGGDLVDDHYLTINQADLDLHVDQGQALVTQVGLDDAAHTAGQLLSLGEVGRAEQTDGDHGVIVDQRVTALIVLDSDLDQIVEPGLGIADVLLVAADEAAPGPGAADELQATLAIDILAKRLGTTHFHGALRQINLHHVGGDVGGMQARKEVVGHRQGLAPLAFYLADHGIGARV